MSSIGAISKRLLDLEKRKHTLLQELDDSLKIQTFWPEAFKQGKCSTLVRHRQWKDEVPRFVIKQGNGAEREWPVTEVSQDLLDLPHIQRTLKQIRDRGSFIPRSGHVIGSDWAKNRK